MTAVAITSTDLDGRPLAVGDAVVLLPGADWPRGAHHGRVNRVHTDGTVTLAIYDRERRLVHGWWTVPSCAVRLAIRAVS